MSEDFFGDLGKSISRYTKKAVDKTSTMVEGAKISAQISAERREIDKLYQKIGETVYRKAVEKDIDLDDDLTAFVDEIRQRKEKTASLTRDLADVKGQKVCQNCGELIPKEVAFCPKCGAPTPVEKEKPDEESEEEQAKKEEEKKAAEKTEEQKKKDLEALDAEFTEIRDEEVVEEETVSESNESKENVTEEETEKTETTSSEEKKTDEPVKDNEKADKEDQAGAEESKTEENSEAKEQEDSDKEKAEDPKKG